MNKELSVVLNDLPARIEKLSRDSIKNVFGGCMQAGQTCDCKDHTCCDGMKCMESSGAGLADPPICV